MKLLVIGSEAPDFLQKCSEIHEVYTAGNISAVEAVTEPDLVLVWEGCLKQWLSLPLSEETAFGLIGKEPDPEVLILAMERGCMGYLTVPLREEKTLGLLKRMAQRVGDAQRLPDYRALAEADFWMGVITRRVSGDALRLQEEARRKNVEIRGMIQPVFVRYRARHPEWGLQESLPDCDIEGEIRRRFRQEYFSEFSGVQVLTISPHKLILLLFARDVEMPYEKVRLGCERFLEECPRIGLDSLCLLGDPADVQTLSDQVEKLVRVGNDQVYLDNHLLPSRQDKQKLENPPQPNVEKYLTLLDGGMYDTACRELKEFFYTPAVMPKVNNNFLMNFRYQLLDGLRELRAPRKSGVNILKDIPEDAINSSSDSVQDFLAFFALIVSALSKLKQYNDGNRNIVEEVKIHIRDHLTEELSRERIAQRFYLSADYLDRLFRREEQKTVTEYILESRLELAKQLLQNRRLLISDVAYKAGFLNAAHFTRVFKKSTGLTPNGYRKQLQ